MLMASILFCSLTLTGCVTSRVVVIPADRAVSRLEAGKAFTPASPGYFVPDARMKEILDALEQKQFDGEVK